MKFFGNGIVWDVENNKPLCRFVDGEYAAADNRTAGILAARGYAHDDEGAPPPEIMPLAGPGLVMLSTDTPGPGRQGSAPDYAELTKADLIAALDLAKTPYTNTDKRTKARLIELLTGGAGNG